MVDLKKYIDQETEKRAINDRKINQNFTKFLVSNGWFGKQPVLNDGKVLLCEEDFLWIKGNIDAFLDNYSKTTDEKVVYLKQEIRKIFPKTAELLNKYILEFAPESNAAYQLSDFLLYRLAGEISGATDEEIGMLMDDGYDDLPKAYGDILADFINWVKTQVKTVYRQEYYMNNYSSFDSESEAYDPYNYLKILYFLFNEDYVNETCMYEKAAKSKNYVDTWLFLSLHFVCAIRNTDIIRIPHPRLKDSPQIVLEKILSNTFSDDEARLVLYSIIWHLEVIKLTPNKTKKDSGIDNIKIHIPESIEVHMGKLLAIAEAHYQLLNDSADNSLMRVISTYEEINRYMGEEIGDLFLESNFKSRAANKSYMQMIFLLTDDVLGIDDEFRVKGYILAALARSHKGSYGDFAKTTSIYLKDAKMNGYTPEFVAREMFERGVLSFIPSMLLKMISGKDYESLSVENQTKAIKALRLTPLDVERAVSTMQTNMKRSVEIAKGVYAHLTKEQILTTLHKIGNGEAISKCDGCMCLITAMGKVCPYCDNQNCPSCEYEISTKTTMFVMLEEYKRLKKVYSESSLSLEKNRAKSIMQDVVAPAIDGMLKMVEETYGEQGIELLEKIIMEAY